MSSPRKRQMKRDRREKRKRERDRARLDKLPVSTGFHATSKEARRHNQLGKLKVLLRRGIINNEQLAKKMNVSEYVIERDIGLLKEQWRSEAVADVKRNVRENRHSPSEVHEEAVHSLRKSGLSDEEIDAMLNVYGNPMPKEGLSVPKAAESMRRVISKLDPTLVPQTPQEATDDPAKIAGPQTIQTPILKSEPESELTYTVDFPDFVEMSFVPIPSNENATIYTPRRSWWRRLLRWMRIKK